MGVRFGWGAGLVAVLMASLLTAAPCAAQPWRRPAAPTAEDEADARDLYQEAVAALDAGKVDDGIALLTASYGKSGAFLPLYALAVAYSRAKDFGNAYAAAKDVLRNHPELPPDLRSSAEQVLAEARSQIGILWLHGVPPGDGAEVSLDDEMLTPGRERPVVQTVKPGAHRGRVVRHDDDAEFTWRGEVPAGADVDITVAFAKEDDDRAAGAGPLSTRPSNEDGDGGAFYESPWFWVAAGAVVLVAGGVIIGVAASGDSGLSPRGKAVIEL